MRDTHVLNLFGRKESKLDFLDRAQRRTRVLEVEIRHVCELSIPLDLKCELSGGGLKVMCACCAEESSLHCKNSHKVGQYGAHKLRRNPEKVSRR